VEQGSASNRAVVPTGSVLPDRARVVIIGAGVMGTSLAYHLTRLGWRDVLVLEQGEISGGTTWHAAGIIGQIRSHPSLTRLAMDSVALYRALERETGQATGWLQCGALWVAKTSERMTHLYRTANLAKAFGVDCEMISPREALQRWPLMDISDLFGALWLPDDGKANPVDVTRALAIGARQGGATIVERTRVTGINRQGNVVTGVQTPHGAVECEIVVNCAGQWAKRVGAMVGATVPLHSAEHFYAVTEPIEGITRDLPILRDPDSFVYFKEEVGGLLVGGFEPDAKPWLNPDEVPDDFVFQLLEEDWEQFAPIMANCIARVPALGLAGVKKLYNGPESFTPDTNFIMGEAPGLRNFFVACGFNSGGIASGGGAGRALAEWIVSGEPSMDLWPVDIRRFSQLQGNSRWLRERVTEALNLHYALPWPNREPETGRPLRRSPIYHLLVERGACFGTRMGYERADWFGDPLSRPVTEYSFGKQNWLPYSGREHAGTREAVALFDQSSFSKLLVRGPDAADTLEALCTNDIARPVGSVVYTGALNDRGGYESDFTVTRTDVEEFLVVTGSTQGIRDLDWIQRNVHAGARVEVLDVSSMYSVFGVMGPRSRELLERVSSVHLDDDLFPYGTSQQIYLGFAQVRASRISYVGELGWELYVPSDQAQTAYETLMAAGETLGIMDGGYYAIESLRLECGYRAWGKDLNPDCTPLEAGLSFACKLGGSVPFRGRAALEAQRSGGVRKRLVSFVLDDREPTLWGGELILRDGEVAGRLTSGAFGHTIGAAVGLGYVERPDGVVDAGYLLDAKYEIDLGGHLTSATVHRSAPYSSRQRGKWRQPSFGPS
jgi:glycine cleavage system aminomethyltransferase T/glycine/D-amino acid oxidase-like deaminating enzyme